MPLESGSFWSALNRLWPLDSDQAEEGAGHLRLLKDTTLNQWPNLTAQAVNANVAELNRLVGLLTSTAELNLLQGLVADAADLNKTQTSTSQAELDLLTGLTANAAELNTMDGIVVSTAVLNLLVGLTSTGPEIDSAVALAEAQQGQMWSIYWDGDDGTIERGPAGWTITYANPGTYTLNHNLNKADLSISVQIHDAGDGAPRAEFRRPGCNGRALEQQQHDH